jgi:hypothetical protein
MQNQKHKGDSQSRPFLHPKRIYPKIADYHCGPYKVGAILRDPGRPEARSGADLTREIGVLNYRAKASDKTAQNCHQALETAGFPLAHYLPMNAIPWYDGQANQASLIEGSLYNAALITEHKVSKIILFGSEARRSRGFLEANIPFDIDVLELPHPSTRGLQAFQRQVEAATFSEAKNLYFEKVAAFLIKAMDQSNSRR